MASTINRALLFLAGGVAAAAVTAYVSGALDPYLGRKPEAVVTAPEAAAPTAETKEGRLPAQPQTTPASAGQTAAESPAASEAPAAPAKTADVAAEVLAPSFDIVRAEANGSLVIAGKAAPSAKVEIVLGAKVIGNTTAGAEGDFAVVIEEPLKPGAHQIVLRSTNPDNVVSTSPETAIVSIPETKDGQVLALVEQPGAPSKLISVPEPEPAPKVPEQQASGAEPAAGASSETTPSAGELAASAGQQSAQEVATAQPAPASVAQEPVASGQPKVKVEAVEIEGRKVFVAGVADAGRKLRAYANDILLGEVAASAGGRFLIETERDLPVGDYIIRVDALEADGVKVAARAAVPFEREPGDAVSAVAPDAAKTEQAPAAAAEAGSGEVAAANPQELAPKLQNVDGAVIIRRGDSLWRISRRVYGLGVRYSTIYLANQDQIRDPDRIWPGQVFRVPEKTHQGEAADMKAVGEQATTLPQ